MTSASLGFRISALKCGLGGFVFTKPSKAILSYMGLSGKSNPLDSPLKN